MRARYVNPTPAGLGGVTSILYELDHRYKYSFLGIKCCSFLIRYIFDHAQSPLVDLQKKFDVGGFSFMVILNPLVSTFKVWILFCLGKNLLITSILTCCAKNPGNQ